MAIMTQEEKQLLLKDLCARLPYSLQIHIITVFQSVEFDGTLRCHDLEALTSYRIEIKPYLRPLSSMTEEENTTYEYGFLYSNDLQIYAEEYIDWLNAHHFDYRGLIEKGLALEALEGMYNI